MVLRPASFPRPVVEQPCYAEACRRAGRMGVETDIRVGGTRIVPLFFDVRPTSALAQSPPVSVHFAGQAVVTYTRVDPIPGGGSLGETRIEQDMVTAMASVAGDHLRFTGTLNLEGITMPNGVLTLGGWGEG